jgi:hypothetical protein
MRSSILILLATSCTSEGKLASSDLLIIEPGTVSEIQVVPTVGQGTLSVPVRLNNTYGLAVPGGAAPSVTVSGPGAVILSDDLTPDTFGVATVDVEAAPGSVVTVDADGSIGSAWFLSGPLPSLQAVRGAAYPEDAPLPSFAADGTSGSAFAGEDEIWWQPSAPGSVGWRTANLPSTIQGMWSVQADSDGVLDLAVWAGQQIFLMRGWPGGGYAWGTAWDVPDGDVIGVAPTDVDGDRLVDIVIGIDYGEDARVEMLLGDGAWGFEAIDPLELTFGISTITAADEDFDGQPDISMIRSVDGSIRRYSYLEEGWSGGTPAQISLNNDTTLLGGTLRPMVDLNGDGDLELVIEGPKGASSQRLVFFAFNGNTIIKYEQAYANYFLNISDMEGDGAADVLAVEDGILHLTRYDGEGGSFVAQNYSEISESGPVSIADINGDSLLDMTLFADVPTYFLGAQSEGGASPPGDPQCVDEVDNDEDGTIDLDDPQCAAWRPAVYTWRTFGLNLSGGYAILDLDEDGSDDIIGYAEVGGAYALEPWRSTMDDSDTPQLTSGAGYELFNSGTPLGLAVCGVDIYSLYETSSGQTVLARVEIVSGSDLVQARASDEVTGTLLSCGVMDGQDVAVVATEGGDWTSYDQARLDILDTGFIESVDAIAIANGTVVGCLGQGCSVVAADVDNDGTDEVFRSEDAGITAEGWDRTSALSGSGQLRVVDADGDGTPEVLVTDPSSQRVMWYAGVTGGIAPPISWWRDGVISDSASLGDLNMDGTPELIIPTENGGLAHSPILP